MANIPASVTKHPRGLGPGNGPVGTVQVRNDYGTLGFGGACPPPGKLHRYIFTVYASGVEKLPIEASTTPAVVGFMILANTIGKANLTAIYGR
jgi:Raf kinase inhibitor-like YbhB/YbcL family protein